jgi:hypothetical protein
MCSHGAAPRAYLGEQKLAICGDVLGQYRPSSEARNRSPATSRRPSKTVTVDRFGNIADGGGIIAMTKVPNTNSEPTSCTEIETSTVIVKGALSRQFPVPGSWSVLATDGKRIALAQLSTKGVRTGQTADRRHGGRTLATPRFRAGDVRKGEPGRLTPKGLVLYVGGRGLVGTGSKLLLKDESKVTIAEGRIFYLPDKTIRARRLRDGIDRKVITLPSSLAAFEGGSFGLAVLAAGRKSSRVSAYSVPWRMIDAILPA